MRGALNLPPLRAAEGAARTRFERPLAHGFLVVAVVYVLAVATQAVVGQGDAHIYWSSRLPAPYAFGEYVPDGPGFFYSPAFAQLIAPLTAAPWPTFAAIWTAVALAVLWVIAGRWAVLTLLFVPVAIELHSGNVNLLIAAVCIFGLRWPALWAFPILTKVTPGIGLVWFVARGEWRKLGVALGSTGLITIGSYLLAPGLWHEWIALLTSNAGSQGWVPLPPLPLRLVAAAALVWWGGRTDRPWVLPVAIAISFAALWPASLSVLVAVPFLGDRATTHSHRGAGRSWMAA